MVEHRGRLTRNVTRRAPDVITICFLAVFSGSPLQLSPPSNISHLVSMVKHPRPTHRINSIPEGRHEFPTPTLPPTHPGDGGFSFSRKFPRRSAGLGRRRTRRTSWQSWLRLRKRRNQSQPLSRCRWRTRQRWRIRRRWRIGRRWRTGCLRLPRTYLSCPSLRSRSRSRRGRKWRRTECPWRLSFGLVGRFVVLRVGFVFACIQRKLRWGREPRQRASLWRGGLVLLLRTFGGGLDVDSGAAPQKVEVDSRLCRWGGGEPARSILLCHARVACWFVARF